MGNNPSVAAKFGRSQRFACKGIERLICTRELFAGHHLRCTRQREALFEALRAAKTHPTADELYRMLSRDGTRGMSRATVYNTLDTLCEVGLVRRMPTTSGICRFDADTSDHLHVRVGDGEIRDVPLALGKHLVNGIPPETLRAIEAHMGVKIESIHIQLVAKNATS